MKPRLHLAPFAEDVLSGYWLGPQSAGVLAFALLLLVLFVQQWLPFAAILARLPQGIVYHLVFFEGTAGDLDHVLLLDLLSAAC